MLGFVLTALLFHIIPNILMKVIKSTHVGHKLLGATFSAGIELGRTNKVFNKAHKQLLKYGIGPEALVEYELGMKLGKDLSKLSIEYQEIYLTAFKEGILANYNMMTEEEKAVAHKTPFINTLITYAQGEVNTSFEAMIIKHSQEQNATFVKGFCMNLLLLAVLVIIEPHILFQPTISFIRGKVGMSKIGKEFLKKNFSKGFNGNKISFVEGFLTDLLLSPSALDTKRLGYAISGGTK